MIDKTELMLGALVNFRPLGQTESKVYRVNTMYPDMVNLAYKEGGYDYWVDGVDYEKIFPIEISSIILEHNGFTQEKCGGGYWWRLWKCVNDEFVYCVDYNTKYKYVNAQKTNRHTGDIISNCVNDNCKYLHQLQRSMWMGGIRTEVIL